MYSCLTWKPLCRLKKSLVLFLLLLLFGHCHLFSQGSEEEKEEKEGEVKANDPYAHLSKKEKKKLKKQVSHGSCGLCGL